jgi:hypothetical protein
MRLLFTYLAIGLILFSCKPSRADGNIVEKEESDPPKIEKALSYWEKMEIIFDEIVESVNGLYPPRTNPKFTRLDKYGNEYYWDSRLNGFRCSIRHSPDLEVITGLQDYIVKISIYTGRSYSASITDISFLEHLPQLRILDIAYGENIEIFEPLKYLVSLEELRIDDSKKTFDCSILSNFDNLKIIHLIVDDLANKETIFSLPNLKEIWLSDYYINTTFPSFYSAWNGHYYEYGPARIYGLGKYHILQYRANIRTEPSRNSDAVAILQFHAEVEILESSWIAEKINNVWGLWYKIKYGDIIGYTFGGNIAEHTFVTDIDKNGINDYFYYRYSSYLTINPETDIIIYINNQRINTSALGKYEWMWAEFIENDDHVRVVLSEEGGDTGGWKSYKVTPDGKIEYLTNSRDY